MSKLLVTGSSGLIGSEVVDYFCKLGWAVHGVDSNMRADFFGLGGDTRWNQRRLQATHKNFRHHELDIRDRRAVDPPLETLRPSLIVLMAAQPSHDLAASRPFDDFDVNANGTFNVLEAARRHVPHAVFVHMSTNKVYGDRPNGVPLKEPPTRWDYDDPALKEAFDPVWCPPEPFRRVAQFAPQMRDVRTAQIAELDPFELLTQALPRVQLRGVGRQTGRAQALRRAVREKFSDSVAAVDRCAVPDDDHLAGHFAPQVLEAPDHVVRVDRAPGCGNPACPRATWQ